MECGICYEKYNNNKKKPYSIYSCGHNYCKSCLDGLEKRECPSCKTAIIDTHINYGLIHLLNEIPVGDISVLREQLQNKVTKIENEMSKLIQMLNKSKLEHLKVVKIRKEIENRKHELIEEVLMQLLNDLNAAFSNLNTTINECNNAEKSITIKLTTIKNSLKKHIIDFKDLERLNKDLNSLNVNSQGRKLLNANSEFENKLTNITSALFFKMEINEDVILIRLAEKYLFQANKLFFSSKYEQAIELIDKANALKNDFIEAYFLKGRCLGSLRRYEEAIKCYEKSLEINSEYFPSYNRKGYMLECLSKRDEALVLYKLALEINSNPNDAISYYNKALSLELLKESEKALVFYDKAIELDPFDPLFYFNKAFSLSALKRHQESIFYLDKTIELEANYDLLYSNKAYDLEMLGQYVSAVEHCNRALELNAKNFNAYSIKLRILFNKLDKYEECIETADKALKENPKNFNYYEYKIESLEKLNKTDEVSKLNEFLLKKHNYLSNNYRLNLEVMTNLLKDSTPH